VQSIDALSFGQAAIALGAGRNKAEDAVLPDVGIELSVQAGEQVVQGQVIARLYGHSQEQLQAALECAQLGVRISNQAFAPIPLIYEEIYI
jgi:thymidine phosphorylase